MAGSEEDQWLQEMSDVFARNQQYAKPHPNYQTSLSPGQEAKFRQWVEQSGVPFNLRDPVSDYDMRGYWKDIASAGGSETAVNPNDGQMHFPDTYKTPYHHSFSNESIYAGPNAPAWINDSQLVDPKTGDVVWDEMAFGHRPDVAVSNLPPARAR